MSRATAAAPRSKASEAAPGRQPTRQSRPTPDCRAATSKPLSPPLHDNQTATIMPVPRHQIPILIVARFLSRLPRYKPRLESAFTTHYGRTPVLFLITWVKGILS